MNRRQIEQWHELHPYGARDEAYIDAVLLQIKKLWLARPHQRLAQVLVNVSGSTDPFYIWDEAWFDADEEEPGDVVVMQDPERQEHLAKVREARLKRGLRSPPEGFTSICPKCKQPCPPPTDAGVLCGSCAFFAREDDK